MIPAKKKCEYYHGSLAEEAVQEVQIGEFAFTLLGDIGACIVIVQ